ncbi:MAG: peptidylprolyl isomerase [Myxococcota bacterium]
MRVVLSCLIALVAVGCTAAEAGGVPTVTFETNRGSFTVELYPDKAPKTVENFLAYAKSGHYKGTIFHRVIDGFMIQGGGFDAQLNMKETREPVVNESSNGLSNRRGTIAMARRSDPDSATSQFFVNVADNANLDFGGMRPGAPGYTVFGKVTKGMDVVDAIKAVATQCNSKRPGPCDRQETKGMGDVPVQPITVTKVTVK